MHVVAVCYGQKDCVREEKERGVVDSGEGNLKVYIVQWTPCRA